MATKIQIEDYFYEEGTVGSQMLGNYSFSDTSCWSLSGSWTIANGKATAVPTSSVGYGHLRQFTIGNATGQMTSPTSDCMSTQLVEGVSYRMSYQVENKTQGNIYLNDRNADCTVDLLLPSSNGTHVFDFVQPSCNTDVFTIFNSGLFDGSIKYITLYTLTGINRNKSIIGELELEDHINFPLALTLQIQELQDITATSGDYSKTFNVPATKHNNKLLKHIYNPLIIPQNNPRKFKNCKIIIDGLQQFTGVIKVVGIGGRGENPSYYECVFYGNNMSWAKKIDTKFLNEPELLPNSTGLTYDRPSIADTWQHTNSDASSPIVYPIVSYGDFNPEGDDYTIQMLNTKHEQYSSNDSTEVGYFGWFDVSGEYGTPHPSSDWRPAIFVKTTLERIFQKAGYKISSAFMETDMFKGLVWLLPNFIYNNPVERYDDYGIEGEWNNSESLTVAAEGDLPAIPAEDGLQRRSQTLNEDDGDTYFSGGGQTIFDLTSGNLNVTLDNGSYIDKPNNEITVGEYGNYDIRLTGMLCRVARAYRDSGNNQELEELEYCVNVEVQTVGQSSWNIIGRVSVVLEPTDDGTTSGSHWTEDDIPLYTANYKSMGNFEAQKVWLNKGDKIKLTKGVQIPEDKTSSSNLDFKTYGFYKAASNAILNISIDPIGVYWGQTYDLDKVINSDYRQIDFIKGVAHAFNLVMTTDAESNTVYIEPFNDFYDPPANARDWTSRLDRSKEVKDKWMPEVLKRRFVFKYKSDDKDARVKLRGDVFFDGIHDEYPYWEDLSDNFEKGESIFENPFFAGTYNAPADRDAGINSNSSLHSACLWQDKGDGTQTSPNDWARPDKGYEFLPRLLFWNKLTDVDRDASDTSFRAKIQTWASTQRDITANKNQTNVASQIFPQATMINRNIIEGAASAALSYGNFWQRTLDGTDPAAEWSSPPTITSGLYDTYYRGMVEMLKNSPRVRTLYVKLRAKEILSIDFRRLIYIDGAYWRLSKIIDYMPNKNTPTKVELVEWVESGVHALHPPSLGASSSSFGSGIWDDVEVIVSGGVLDHDNHHG